jgi:signal transduction histidine kinase
VLEELTRDLIRQEKQAYEKLIRMMSHEINNSIGAVNSLLQSFHYYAPHLPSEDQPDFTEALEVSHTRNTHLVNFIGSFATLVRLPAPQRRPVELHEILRATCRLLQVPCQQKNVTWEWDLAAGPLYADADGVQLEQALLNIAKNALEAIPAEQGGTITVRTSKAPPEIRIENDGNPIPYEVQKRLFTPFFSTKRDGQGIGLTLVRDILMAHDYRFALETQPDGVTAFTVWL